MQLNCLWLLIKNLFYSTLTGYYLSALYNLVLTLFLSLGNLLFVLALTTNSYT